MEDIAADDEKAEEEWAAYDEYENTKGSNEKGKKKPTTPIRILETNASYSAILTSFINCVKGGYAKNLCCFTKCEEIVELYDMGVTNGRQKVMQLCKKTYDRGRIGANRSTSIATKGHAPLRWNWLSSTTPGNARKFFKKSLTDGTVSRIDFSLMLPPADLKKFVYGDYDDDFYDELEPYIRNLRDYRGQWDKRGHLKPLKITQLFRIDEEMSVYIDEYSKTMPDDTWKNFAWRTKLNAIKKIIVLYIANGGKWEEEFEPFCWWCFYYSMWVKMSLFYEKASVEFLEEGVISDFEISSPLEILDDKFTREEFYNALKKVGHKSNPANALSRFKSRGQIRKVSKNVFEKTHSLIHSLTQK